MFATIIALVVVGGIGFTILNRFIFVPMASSQPDNLGWQDGDGFREVDTPMNYVSSTINPDKMPYIQPIEFDGTAEDAHDTLMSIIAEMPRHEVITDDGQYIHVVFRSLMMGFPDDAEFYIDEENGSIEGIMAARLGEGDLGANRNRFEEIREEFKARSNTTEPEVEQQTQQERDIVSA